MNSNILNVGIAGLGRLGKRHAEQLARNTPGARLVAACSPVGAKRVAKNAAKRVANARSSCEVVFMVAVPSAHGVDSPP